MSLHSGLQTLEGIGRLGITAEAATSLQQALDRGADDSELARRIEECPVSLVLVLQLASASFYRGHSTPSGLPMALGVLGGPMIRQMLQALLLGLPRRQAGHGEQELRSKLDQAEARILPVCGRGSSALLHTTLCLFRLVPLLVSQEGAPRVPEWRTWGRLLLERLGPDTLPPAISQLLGHLENSAVEEEDPELATNLALLQVILAVGAGQGIRQCDPGLWRMLELPTHLMQSLSAGEPHRG